MCLSGRVCLPMQLLLETQVRSLGREDALEEEMATQSQVFLPGKFPWTEKEVWRATVHGVAKSDTTE